MIEVTKAKRTMTSAGERPEIARLQPTTLPFNVDDPDFKGYFPFDEPYGIQVSSLSLYFTIKTIAVSITVVLLTLSTMLIA